ncbi:alpha amylase catalytic region (plasmid) [Stanieria cyanosphaera PCC 7437]|uniref:Alpha amylase catalytic region n=1 Tax=Stanieria cyanosphaera (strain ATCC 29371 / PCC 7437) TaxID=111780 RepID=K9Y2N3_STAC7|nr:alpha-amylase family glycosyl hydrolase [Stanieria cyanosphaera]AFZ38287.1 alpha amylase catalytic region [Stanieria cyanosphaera PCC 7437]
MWEVEATKCQLEEGRVYYYWFKVRNTEPYDSGNVNQILYCTDPIAFTIDRRVRAPKPENVLIGKTGISSSAPASVILYQNRKLIPCDPDGRIIDWNNDTSPRELPPNNKLVIYELPTRWTRLTSRDGIEVGNGTFKDALALLVPNLLAPTFLTVAALNNRAHLLELGINAFELLPPADSDQPDQWGYGTSNYFAADFELGFPVSAPEPTASHDLVELIKTCHQKNIRFFKDTVMAFATGTSLRNINFLDFFVKFGSGDPEQEGRDGFGGDLIKYNYSVSGYEPISGKQNNLFPARAFLKAYLFHWLTYYRVDGLRLDSVNNIKNYDFLEEVKNFSRAVWKERQGNDGNFLVIGESIGFQRAMLDQKRLDSFWNEDFKYRVKSAVVGRNYKDDPNFETTIRKMIDCRNLNLGFQDGSQVINYITSHDVEGEGAERLYNYLDFFKIYEKEQRIKLAFVCLLTAVGIPMILAGDEFADRMDNDIFNVSGDERNFRKQVDPVNFSRWDDEWRKRVFYYVARLIKFRTKSEALAVNDTDFIHVDFNQGKRILAWKRGSGNDVVVVVANFSDWGSDLHSPNAKYLVQNWPPLPSGKKWHEITQERDIPIEWAGKEPIFPWEAKVYAVV